MKYLSEIQSCETHQFDATPATSHQSVMRILCNNTLVASVDGLYMNGVWNYYGVRDIIKNNMIESTYHLAAYSISYVLLNGELTVETDTDSLEVLYCEDHVASPDADDFVLGNFLHSRPAFIAPGMTERLYFVNDGEQMYNKKVVTLIDGQTYIWPTNPTIPRNRNYIDVTMEDTAQYDIEDIVSITIICGSREITFFAIHDDVQLFRFRNRFNVIETIPLQCGMVMKPETEFETALIGDTSVRYDIEHSVQNELTTPTILPQFLSVLLQLVRSNYVQHFNKTRSDDGNLIGWEDIIITDYTLEPSDTHNSPVTFEMTFERANKIETIFLD